MALTWKSNLFLFKVLGEFSFYKMSNFIVSHVLLNGKKIPTKANYHDENHLHMILVFVLSFVKLC